MSQSLGPPKHALPHRKSRVFTLRVEMQIGIDDVAQPRAFGSPRGSGAGDPR